MRHIPTSQLEISHPTEVIGPAGRTLEDLSLEGNNPRTFPDALMTMSCEDVRAADISPYEYLIPWIHGVTSDWMDSTLKVEQQLTFEKLEDYDQNDMKRIVMDQEFLLQNLDRTVINLTNFVQNHPEANTAKFASAMQVFQQLQARAEKAQTRISFLWSRLSNRLALEASRKSIEQSVSTKRLAQIAYLFLPLSLSTSIFGMNVSELQNVPLQLFFITSAIVLAVSLLLWLTIGWLVTDELLGKMAGNAKCCIILLRYFWRAPRQATVLFAYSACHNSDHTSLLVYHLGLWELLWNHESPKRSPFTMANFFYLKSSWSKSLYKQVPEVETFTKQSDWQRRSFWGFRTTSTLKTHHSA